MANRCIILKGKEDVNELDGRMSHLIKHKVLLNTLKKQRFLFEPHHIKYLSDP